MPRKFPEVAPKDDAEPGSRLLTFAKVTLGSSAHIDYQPITRFVEQR